MVGVSLFEIDSSNGNYDSSGESQRSGESGSCGVDGTSSHRTGTSDVETASTGSRTSKNSHNAMIRNEENAVRRTRLLVFFVIALCSLVIFLAVFFLSKQSDVRSFELEVRKVYRCWLIDYEGFQSFFFKEECTQLSFYLFIM